MHERTHATHTHTHAYTHTHSHTLTSKAAFMVGKSESEPMMMPTWGWLDSEGPSAWCIAAAEAFSA